MRPRQNGRRFPNDIFKHIFMNQNICISSKISLKFVPKGPINNIPALVQITTWRRSGDKPLSEPMTVSLLTHICVARPQWVNKQIAISPERWVTKSVRGMASWLECATFMGPKPLSWHFWPLWELHLISMCWLSLPLMLPEWFLQLEANCTMVFYLHVLYMKWKYLGYSYIDCAEKAKTKIAISYMWCFILTVFIIKLNNQFWSAKSKSCTEPDSLLGLLYVIASLMSSTSLIPTTMQPTRLHGCGDEACYNITSLIGTTLSLRHSMFGWDLKYTSQEQCTHSVLAIFVLVGYWWILPISFSSTSKVLWQPYTDERTSTNMSAGLKRIHL